MALKYSRQREAIKEFLVPRKDHPTADVVYMGVRKDFPNISLGTVYRNLTLLADLGEIARIRVGDGTDHFDPNTIPHYHFLCQKCGKVTDLDVNGVDKLNELASVSFDGKIEGSITYFYGICRDCLKEGN